MGDWHAGRKILDMLTPQAQGAVLVGDVVLQLPRWTGTDESGVVHSLTLRCLALFAGKGCGWQPLTRQITRRSLEAAAMACVVEEGEVEVWRQPLGAETLPLLRHGLHCGGEGGGRWM